jgi:hypothetical protein
MNSTPFRLQTVLNKRGDVKGLSHLTAWTPHRAAVQNLVESVSYRSWIIKANRSNSVRVTFITRRETCPPVHINNVLLPQEEDAKYLELHIDRGLTRHKRIFTKRKQLGTNLTKMYWLLGYKSKFSTSNKLLIHQIILQPIWTYGIQLWGTASTSIREILEHFQSKALCMIVEAPLYVPNAVIRRDPQTPTVKEEIRRYSSQYSAGLSAHPNGLVVNLTEQPDNRRLRRHLPNYLPTRFLL